MLGYLREKFEKRLVECPKTKKFEGSLLARQTRNKRVTVRGRRLHGRTRGFRKKSFLAARQRTKEIHTKRRRQLCKDETMDLFGQRLALSGFQGGWRGHRWGGYLCGRGGTRGREISQSSGRAGTLFRLRAYTKISRAKHKRANNESRKKLRRTQRYRGGQGGGFVQRA